MKGFIIKLVVIVVVLTTLIGLYNFYFPYSQGVRAGELVKFSKKGYVFKTWEGELSQGVSEATRFFFSVEKGNQHIVDQLFDTQNQHVKLFYSERFFTFPWISDTKYFVDSVAVSGRLLNSTEE